MKTLWWTIPVFGDLRVVLEYHVECFGEGFICAEISYFGSKECSLAGMSWLEKAHQSQSSKSSLTQIKQHSSEWKSLILVFLSNIIGVINSEFVSANQIVYQIFYLQVLKRLTRRLRDLLNCGVWLFHHYNIPVHISISGLPFWLIRTWVALATYPIRRI